MKPLHTAYLGLGAALLVLAGCAASPESRIQAACMKAGPGTPQSGQPAPSAAELKRYCDCFTKNVKQSMTPAELKTFADKFSSANADDRDFTKMPPEVGQKAMMATKSCAMT